MDERFDIDQHTAATIGQILIDEVGLHDDRGETYASALGYRRVVDWLFREGAAGGEFRLNADLGFGGKLRVYGYDYAPRVDYYPEDDTPQRRTAIDLANGRLRGLFEGRPLRTLLRREPRS